MSASPAGLNNPPIPDIPRADLERYSISRAIRIAAGWQEGRGTREGEIDELLRGPFANALGLSRTPQGFLIPLGIPGSVRAGLDGGTATKGAELKVTAAGSFVDGLRARSVTGSLGATMLTIPRFPVSEPRLDADVAVSWVDENPGSNMSDSTPTTGSVDYTLHTLACNVPYSRQLVRQGGELGVDAIVSRIVEAAIGAELDAAAIKGSGSSNEPTGILSTTGIGDVAIGANGGAPTYSAVVDLEYEVAIDDADAARLGFATTPGMRQKLRKTESISGSGRAIWFNDQVLGYPGAVSSNVPATLTKGTNTDCHAIIFGNWSDLVVTMLPALDVVVDPFSLKKQGMIEVTSFLYCDIQLRHAASFAAIQDARNV